MTSPTGTPGTLDQWPVLHADTRVSVDKVEVDLFVAVVWRESWGTSSHTYTVTGSSDIAQFTREGIAAAESSARHEAMRAANAIRDAQPDYQDPPRY